MYTREKTRSHICDFAFQSGEKKHGSFFYMLSDISFEISIRKCAVYRRKWLEGHVAPPSNYNFEVEVFIQRFAAWFERCVTGKHLRTVIWIAQFKLRIAMQICVHKVQNTVIRVMRNSNDHSNCALCSCVKTLLVSFSIGLRMLWSVEDWIYRMCYKFQLYASCILML